MFKKLVGIVYHVLDLKQPYSRPNTWPALSKESQNKNSYKVAPEICRKGRGISNTIDSHLYRLCTPSNRWVRKGKCFVDLFLRTVRNRRFRVWLSWSSLGSFSRFVPRHCNVSTVRLSNGPSLLHRLPELAGVVPLMTRYDSQYYQVSGEGAKFHTAHMWYG